MKITIKNKSSSNQRLCFVPKSGALAVLPNPQVNPTINIHETGEVYLCLSPLDLSPEIINATYDSLSQTMSVTGRVGLAVETKDENNVSLGSGIIGSDGTVTYPIDTQSLNEGSEVFTSGLNTNTVISIFNLPTDLTLKVNGGEYGGNDLYVSNIYLEDENGNEDLSISVEVNWGDGGPTETFTGYGIYDAYRSWDEPNQEAIVTFKFNKTVPMFHISGDAIVEVISFGQSPITNLRFDYAKNLVKLPVYLPSYMTSLERMFEDCVNLNCPNISKWDVSHVTNFTRTFTDADSFNQPLNDWDVSSAVTLESMFYDASSFDQPLNKWNISNVKSLKLTFGQAYSFNQNINDWDTSNVENMWGVFYNTDNFNQPLDNWNTSKVTDMHGTFQQTRAFNQDISMWDVSKVTDMTWMFYQALVFNQDLSPWCVSLIPNLPQSFDAQASAWTLPRPIWGTCPDRVEPIDTSWDIEYTLSGSTSKMLTGNPIPYNFSASNTALRASSNLVINRTITQINGYAFSGWDQATSVVIPDTVERLEDYAFYGWTNGQNLVIPGSVSTIMTGVFWGWVNATSLTLSEGISFVGAAAFRDWTSALSLTIPESMTVINGSFQGWSSATSLILPNTVTSIDHTAFLDWTSATELNLPSSLTSIGQDSFRGWTSATSLTIPEGIVSMGQGAFRDWTSATELNLPNDISIIPSGCFMNWTSLSSVIIPASVTLIGDGAFAGGGASRTSITILATTPPELQAFGLGENSATYPIYVPAGSVQAYKDAWITHSFVVPRIFAIPA